MKNLLTLIFIFILTSCVAPQSKIIVANSSKTKRVPAQTVVIDDKSQVMNLFKKLKVKETSDLSNSQIVEKILKPMNKLGLNIRYSPGLEEIKLGNRSVEANYGAGLSLSSEPRVVFGRKLTMATGSLEGEFNIAGKSSLPEKNRIDNVRLVDASGNNFYRTDIYRKSGQHIGVVETDIFVLNFHSESGSVEPTLEMMKHSKYDYPVTRESIITRDTTHSIFSKKIQNDSKWRNSIIFDIYLGYLRNKNLEALDEESLLKGLRYASNEYYFKDKRAKLSRDVVVKNAGVFVELNKQVQEKIVQCVTNPSRKNIESLQGAFKKLEENRKVIVISLLTKLISMEIENYIEARAADNDTL